MFEHVSFVINLSILWNKNIISSQCSRVSHVYHIDL